MSLFLFDDEGKKIEMSEEELQAEINRPHSPFRFPIDEMALSIHDDDDVMDLGDGIMEEAMEAEDVNLQNFGDVRDGRRAQQNNVNGHNEKKEESGPKVTADYERLDISDPNGGGAPRQDRFQALGITGPPPGRQGPKKRAADIGPGPAIKKTSSEPPGPSDSQGASNAPGPSNAHRRM